MDVFTVTADLVDYLESDLKESLTFDTGTSVGNFKTLRARVNGTEREILGFGISGTQWRIPTSEDEILDILKALRDGASGHPDFVNFFVVWSAATGNEDITECVLVAPTHEPTPAAPLHIGGQEGIHPFQLVKDIYDEIGIRYNTTAMNDLINDEDFPLVRFRVPEPAMAGPWLEENIYGPLLVAPFVNADGEVAPQKIGMPQGTDPSTLRTVSSTSLSEPHPEFRYIGREIVTKLIYKWTSEDAISDPLSVGEDIEAGEFGLDGLKDDEREFIQTHDRSTSLDEHSREVEFRGIHREVTVVINNPGIGGGSRVLFYGIDVLSGVFSREVFQRFGDGPIRGRVSGLSTMEDLTPGQFIKVTNLDTFPTPNTQARGGDRVIQLMTPTFGPAGPDWDYLDAGPASQALAAPGLSLAKSTGRPRNAIVATVSSLSTLATAGWQLQTSVDSTSDWEWSTQGSSTGDFTVVGFPAGSKVNGRVRQTAQNRFRSNWSTVASSTLDSLTAPSTIGVSNSSGGVATVTFTPSSEFRTEVMLDQSTSSTGLEAIDSVARDGDRYVLEGLSEGTDYAVGVRRTDPFGGRSAITSTTFTTSTSSPTAPSPEGPLILLQGRSC